MICVKNLSYVQRHAKALISLLDGREVNDSHKNRSFLQGVNILIRVRDEERRGSLTKWINSF